VIVQNVKDNTVFPFAKRGWMAQRTRWVAEWHAARSRTKTFRTLSKR